MVAVKHDAPPAIERRLARLRRTPHHARCRGGFTLGELLAVLLLLGLVVATVFVAPQYKLYLPDVNATLNGVALVLLLAGYVQIKRRREGSHKALMLAAFATSVLFLTTYLIHHYFAGSRKFGGTGAIWWVYITILVTHIALAAIVPFLAIRVIWLGLTEQRSKHRRLARWTLPIWLYVSVTGVVVYWMLYHAYPPAPAVDPQGSEQQGVEQAGMRRFAEALPS